MRLLNGARAGLLNQLDSLRYASFGRASHNVRVEFGLESVSISLRQQGDLGNSCASQSYIRFGLFWLGRHYTHDSVPRGFTDQAKSGSVIGVLSGAIVSNSSCGK